MAAVVADSAVFVDGTDLERQTYRDVVERPEEMGYVARAFNPPYESCCCGCTLPTAVYFLAFISIVEALLSILGLFVLSYVTTHMDLMEGITLSMIEDDGGAREREQLIEDAMEAVNNPWVICLQVVNSIWMLGTGCVGLHAVRTYDVRTSRFFWIMKGVAVVGHVLFSEDILDCAVTAGLGYYFTRVAWSFAENIKLGVLPVRQIMPLGYRMMSLSGGEEGHVTQAHIVHDPAVSSPHVVYGIPFE